MNREPGSGLAGRTSACRIPGSAQSAISMRLGSRRNPRAYLCSSARPSRSSEPSGSHRASWPVGAGCPRESGTKSSPITPAGIGWPERESSTRSRRAVRGNGWPSSAIVPPAASRTVRRQTRTAPSSACGEPVRSCPRSDRPRWRSPGAVSPACGPCENRWRWRGDSKSRRAGRRRKCSRFPTRPRVPPAVRESSSGVG